MPGFAVDDPTYLDPPEDLDGVLRMVMEVASELWVLRDRFAVLEQRLDEQGTVSREDLETLQPEGEFAERLKVDREQFLRRLGEAMSRHSGVLENGDGSSGG
jgi:hypothetical protein